MNQDKPNYFKKINLEKNVLRFLEIIKKFTIQDYMTVLGSIYRHDSRSCLTNAIRDIFAHSDLFFVKFLIFCNVHCANYILYWISNIFYFWIRRNFFSWNKYESGGMLLQSIIVNISNFRILLENSCLTVYQKHPPSAN
jgi:hypothetical protein